MESIMAYPFAGSNVEGVFNTKTSLNVCETAIRNILMTEKGTVPWNLEFGSVIHTFVFDLNDKFTEQKLIYYAFRDIQQQEPRLWVVGFAAQIQVEEQQVNFTVVFIIADDPSRQERTAEIKVVMQKD